MLSEEKIESMARVAVGRLKQLDESNGTIRSNDTYDGWMNGFLAGALGAWESVTVEEVALDFDPKAHIRIIVGIADSAEIGDVSAFPMGISSECKGVTSKEGVTTMLAAAMAALLNYSAEIAKGFKDEKAFTDSVIRGSQVHGTALKGRMQASMTIMERD